VATTAVGFLVFSGIALRFEDLMRRLHAIGIFCMVLTLASNLCRVWSFQVSFFKWLLLFILLLVYT
jgi:multisubunit Na+/H+ antiporter MnhG subunit